MFNLGVDKLLSMFIFKFFSKSGPKFIETIRFTTFYQNINIWYINHVCIVHSEKWQYIAASIFIFISFICFLFFTCDSLTAITDFVRIFLPSLWLMILIMWHSFLHNQSKIRLISYFFVCHKIFRQNTNWFWAKLFYPFSRNQSDIF